MGSWTGLQLVGHHLLAALLLLTGEAAGSMFGFNTTANPDLATGMHSRSVCSSVLLIAMVRVTGGAAVQQMSVQQTSERACIFETIFAGIVRSIWTGITDTATDAGWKLIIDTVIDADHLCSGNVKKWRRVTDQNPTLQTLQLRGTFSY